MNKIRYRFVSMLLVVFTSVSFVSCLGESEPIEPYTIAVWTAQRAQDQQLYFVSDDDSTTFVPNKTLAYPDSLLGKRCYVEFNLSTQQEVGYTHVIVVQYIQSVPTWGIFDIHTQNQSDSLGYEPTGLELVWVSGNYLNMMYKYYGTGTIKHNFSLARNYFQPESAPDSVVNLEFRHNSRLDNASEYYYNVVSFDISSLAAGKTADFYLNIKYRTFDRYYESFKIKVPIAEIKQSAPFYVGRSTFRLSQWGTK